MIELKDLWRIALWQNEIPWVTIHPGVEIHRLYGDGLTGPTAALIRYAPGARIPLHLHTGYEHIIVLSRSQRDEQGLYAEGTLVINPPGTIHHILSDEGCIVLAIYEQPVRFLPSPSTP